MITGRVVPHIYSFLTNTLPNYLKVGDTYRPVDERLNEWRKYYKDLQEISRHKATINDEVFFRDHAVHAYLTRNGIAQVPFDASKNVHSKEFF
ncbi:MAG: Eco57I restriction endonuclease, partial [Parcubacteria group bacterium Athens0416_74]